MGVPKQLIFNLQNHSRQPYRFEWKPHPDFVFVPSLGHLQATSTKEIKVTFKSAEPRQHKGISLACKLAKIRYQTNTVIDWDDTVTRMLYFIQAEQFLSGRSVISSFFKFPFRKLEERDEITDRPDKNCSYVLLFLGPPY